MSIKNEIAVGIFFFIAMSILGYFTIIMSGEIFETRQYYTITVVFPNVEGLGPGDKVRVNGVDSGTVEDCKLIDNHVLVRLQMYNRFTLYENYVIKVKNLTAMGGKCVAVYPGDPSLKGKRFAVIETRDMLKGQTLDDPFAAISELVSENRENVYLSIRNIMEITQKINTGQGTLGKLLNDNRAHDSADNLIKELRDAIEDTREQAPVTSFLRAALMAF